MKASIRAKIDAARLKHDVQAQMRVQTVVRTIADNVIAGEQKYTLKRVGEICGLDPNTVRRKLKGRPGFLQFGPNSEIQITHSLLQSFIEEAAARGLRN